MSPLGPVLPPPLLMGAQTPDPGRPFKSYRKPTSPKDLWILLGQKSFVKSPGLPSSCPGAGVPPPPSFLRVTTPKDHSTLSGAVLQGLGFLRGVKGNTSGKTHKPLSISSHAFRSPGQPRNPGNPICMWESAAALWPLPVTTLQNLQLMGTS
ncbi:unnamed protein product [Rangifer tarandus platyrhynchus]|uniref:Uncharacterized protein n=2 Tax=Rangifer tarandus platyrhynchus TaxID=3082113 RepID=A0ABN8YCN4_RANTA|nr:unnamed protein product [Rangifer tarandus platyrhynchus]